MRSASQDLGDLFLCKAAYFTGLLEITVCDLMDRAGSHVANFGFTCPATQVQWQSPEA